jgi:hypothetical protein
MGTVLAVIVNDEQSELVGFKVISDRAGAAEYYVDLQTPGVTVELR